MTDISHLDFDPATVPGRIGEWLFLPVKPYLPVLQATKDKPLAELTMQEALAWVAAGSYFAMVGVIAGQLAANVLGVVLRGPARR